MQLTGETLIGSRGVEGTGATVLALNPVTNETMEPAFPDSSIEQVNEACELADAAYDAYRSASLEVRAALLESIAEEILAIGDGLIERAMAESGLPRPRLEGERGRTVGQLKLFATVVRDGRFLNATLDSALPERKPLPRQDLRMRKIPLGPVAVFGASNFPLAFSVAGGDTASALAAGCPVVVKAHPSHPGTSELIGKAVQKAVEKSGLPEGVFSLVHGSTMEVGQALVKHPAIMAVGFTGSRRGGLALVDAASKRPVPIPVYAEMSSVNPVFLLPAALEERGEAIANGYVDSATLGTGQFCTQPGLVFGVEGPALQAFVKTAADRVATKPSTPMLNAGICKAYANGAAMLAADGKLTKIGEGLAADGTGLTGRPALFVTKATDFVKNPHLAEELFGPSSLIVLCENVDEMVSIARGLEGQLTATLQMDAADSAAVKPLLAVLERKAGRILANGYPTGVEVCYAMVHGGPFPSTSDSRTTSVGATAIDRFLRPVCYQDIPQDLLSPELQDENPQGLWRLKDGTLGKA